MATVPTVLIAGIDQTDFVQSKTLSMKLKSLDLTLVDPDTTPAIGDIVFVDVPDWHGRVTTSESHPYHNATGDHRYVQITATNKLELVETMAPFGLSDDPDDVTTFPFRDLSVIHTLSDQTDLSTEEVRATGIVYEPGLVPGMVVEITCAVEGLSATEFSIVEITVEWYRSDYPEYTLDLSVDAKPPITLGGLFQDASCDCPTFVCIPQDFEVHPYGGAADLACVFSSHTNGQRCESDAGDGNTMYVYSGATYRIDYEVFHAADSNGLSASLYRVGGSNIGSPGGTVGTGTETAINMGNKAHHCDFDPPDDIPTASATWEADFTGAVQASLVEGSCLAGDSFGSSISAHIFYVDGPDPRFEGLGPCLNGSPSSGQPVSPQTYTGDGSTDDFETDYSYMSGSLEVSVSGLDWSDQVSETDPDAGEFHLAYPPSDGANMFVRYRFP